MISIAEWVEPGGAGSARAAGLSGASPIRVGEAGP